MQIAPRHHHSNRGQFIGRPLLPNRWQAPCGDPNITAWNYRANDWSAVTCKGCLEHKPKEEAMYDPMGGKPKPSASIHTAVDYASGRDWTTTACINKPKPPILHPVTEKPTQLYLEVFHDGKLSCPVSPISYGVNSHSIGWYDYDEALAWLRRGSDLAAGHEVPRHK